MSTHRDGRIGQRASVAGALGGWAGQVECVNLLIGDLSTTTAEVSRVLGAVAKGDLSQRMATDIDGRPLKGELLKSSKIVNTMVDQLNSFAGRGAGAHRRRRPRDPRGGLLAVRGRGARRRDGLGRAARAGLRDAGTAGADRARHGAAADIGLPLMSGEEVAARLRAHYGEPPPIIVVSADGRAAEKATRIGAQGYLHKSFDIDELMRLVRVALATP